PRAHVIPAPLAGEALRPGLGRDPVQFARSACSPDCNPTTPAVLSPGLVPHVPVRAARRRDDVAVCAQPELHLACGACAIRPWAGRKGLCRPLPWRSRGACARRPPAATCSRPG